MLLLISSILLTAMYFMSGLNKIQTFNDTSNGLSKKPIFKNLPKMFSKFALFIVIILEIFAPLSIITAIYYPEFNLLANFSAIALAIFTLVATLLYHYPPKGVEFYFFMKNITIIGGLLSLSLHFI
jgi:uncharacterized membrane protein YphA (DoxX/SURF4 family)